VTGWVPSPDVGVPMSIDARCIQLASHGDRDAQRVIYEAHVERVYRLVLRLVGRSDAEDVTQNLFLQLFAKLKTFRHESEFATWVHRLAVNEALQHVRRVRRHAAVQLTSTNTAQVAVSNATDWKELFETAMSRIESELRLVLELKELEKMSYSQIAEILGIPEGTVGSRLNRARRELRDQLVALGWEG
jgi:RNA polymerase sigma-70 factor (ECF subfamily)